MILNLKLSKYMENTCKNLLEVFNGATARRLVVEEWQIR